MNADEPQGSIGSSQTHGRLIMHLAPTESQDAAWNMAVDQAIAESTSHACHADAESENDAATPTLRFYTWVRPTLSLGYFQTAADAAPRFSALSLVRRSTGGGAILHHHELTYSLTVPCKVGEHGARNDLYQGVHRAIVDELAANAVMTRPFREDARFCDDEETFLCFQRRTDEDLICSGYKILGSAQRRARRAILQHGSLLLRSSRHAPELPGIFDLTSKSFSTESLAHRIAARIGDQIGVNFSHGELSSNEATQADQIALQRFRCETWWNRR